MPLPQPPLERPLLHLVALLTFLDMVGVAALILLCYFLYKAYRASSIRLFAFFFLGFAVLAAGEVARTFLLLLAFVSKAPRLLLFFLAHSIGPLPQLCQALALLFIASGYALETVRSRAGGEVLALPLPLALLLAQRLWGGLYTLLSFVNVSLLAFILLNAVSVHLISRSRRTILPVVAFALFLLSNLLLLPAVFSTSEELFIASKVVYLAGLLAFLALAVEVARAR
jgi:hypothetical protein